VRGAPGVAWVPFCLLLVAASSTRGMAEAPGSTPDHDAPLRPFDRRMALVLDEGRLHSPTFARLAAEISAADVFVLLTFDIGLPPHTRGLARFLTSAAGHRYFSIALDPRHSDSEIIVCLGHEMQHVVEMMACGVKRPSDVKGCYVKPNAARAFGGRLDSEAALDIGDRVRQELRGAR
jgi:hypothetical protein